MNIKKIFTSRKDYVALFAIIIIIFSVSNTISFYNDLELSNDNNFIAGVIDLETSNSEVYLDSDSGFLNSNNEWEFGETIAKFFDFSDLKPSDSETDLISLRVNTNPAWLCLEIHNIISDDNIDSIPELRDDTTPVGEGELDDDMNFIFWIDNDNGVYDMGEKILWEGKLKENVFLALVDSDNNVFGEIGDALIPNEIYNIQKAWCFGEFNEDYSQCNGRMLNNQSQGDSLIADISFYAIQTRNNLDFLCEESTTEQYRYYSCNENTWTCDLTNYFDSMEDCESIYGVGECYETDNELGCLDECKEPEECEIPFTCDDGNSQTKDDITVTFDEKKKDCNGDYVYRFRIKSCASKGLSHITVSLPPGETVFYPANASTYYYSGNNVEYKIENTTNNPFYGIKYNTIGEGIKKVGLVCQEDVFEFKSDHYIEDYNVAVETKYSGIQTFFDLDCYGLDCVKCKTYQTCDCYECGETEEYDSKEECELGEGIDCYDNYSTCSANCEEPVITIESICGAPTNFVEKIKAMARHGNNSFPNDPAEITLDYLQTQEDKENHVWAKNAYHDFEFKIDADKNVSFDVSSYYLTSEKKVEYGVVSTIGDTLVIKAMAPDCGSIRVDTLVLIDDVCDWQQSISDSIVIENPDAGCDQGAKYIKIKGLDFSKPFTLTGQFKFHWTDETSLVGVDNPSMSIMTGIENQ